MLLSEGGDDLVPDLLERNAERFEDPGRDPLALAHETEKQVLGADVAMAELPSLIDRELDHLLGAWRERDLARGGRRIAAADDELDCGAHLGELDTEGVEDARGDTLAFAHQTEEEVLRSYVVVVETDGLVLGKREDSLCAVVKAVERSHLLRLLKVYRRV